MPPSRGQWLAGVGIGGPRHFPVLMSGTLMTHVPAAAPRLFMLGAVGVVLSIVAIALSGLGSRWGWWRFGTGFYDDVVVRVTPTPNGARVDVRSLSRVGGSDVGTNARRIRAFLTLTRFVSRCAGSSSRFSVSGVTAEGRRQIAGCRGAVSHASPRSMQA